jgi:microcompartment protein CcmL/EutN
LWEFSSIAEGVRIADQIAKGAPVAAITSGTTHPGKYLVLVAGDTASVVVANDIVADDAPATLLDHVFLADIAPSVAAALAAGQSAANLAGDAAGIVETDSVAAAIEAADAAVKDADVALGIIRMADGLGGKGFFIVDGSVGEVTSSVAAAQERAGSHMIGSVVIPQLTDEMRVDLAVSLRFGDTVVSGDPT